MYPPFASKMSTSLEALSLGRYDDLVDLQFHAQTKINQLKDEALKMNDGLTVLNTRILTESMRREDLLLDNFARDLDRMSIDDILRSGYATTKTHSYCSQNSDKRAAACCDILEQEKQKLQQKFTLACQEVETTLTNALRDAFDLGLKHSMAKKTHENTANADTSNSNVLTGAAHSSSIRVISQAKKQSGAAYDNDPWDSYGTAGADFDAQSYTSNGIERLTPASTVSEWTSWETKAPTAVSPKYKNFDFNPKSTGSDAVEKVSKDGWGQPEAHVKNTVEWSSCSAKSERDWQQISSSDVDSLATYGISDKKWVFSNFYTVSSTTSIGNHDHGQIVGNYLDIDVPHLFQPETTWYSVNLINLNAFIAGIDKKIKAINREYTAIVADEHGFYIIFKHGCQEIDAARHIFNVLMTPSSGSLCGRKLQLQKYNIDVFWGSAARFRAW